MKYVEYERLRTLGLKWINESEKNLTECRRTYRPVRLAELEGKLYAKTECFEDLFEFLKEVEVEA